MRCLLRGAFYDSVTEATDVVESLMRQAGRSAIFQDARPSLEAAYGALLSARYALDDAAARQAEVGL